LLVMKISSAEHWILKNLVASPMLSRAQSLAQSANQLSNLDD
jgi:hypothetical protein